MDLSSIALQGLDQASAQLDAAASRIAGAGMPSGDGASLDTVSLSEEMVALMSAKNLFSANVASLKTADQTQQNLLDIMA
jgi:flagellar hook protein FlgE